MCIYKCLSICACVCRAVQYSILDQTGSPQSGPRSRASRFSVFSPVPIWTDGPKMGCCFIYFFGGPVGTIVLDGTGQPCHFSAFSYPRPIQDQFQFCSVRSGLGPVLLRSDLRSMPLLEFGFGPGRSGPVRSWTGLHPYMYVYIST